MQACVYIQPKNSLLREKQRGEALTKIVARITEFPDFRKYRNDLELLTMVCQIVEHLIDNKADAKNKVDKKLLVTEAYCLAFGQLTPAEAELLGRNIEYLIDNDKIKKLHFAKIAMESMKNWFHRKVLS